MGGQTFGFRDVDHDNWDDLVRLFEARGGPKNCWCMAWRRKPPEAHKGTTAERKAKLKHALHARIEDGTPIGILCYCNGEPIAWCSIAPRHTYRSMRGVSEKNDQSDAVWSLVCFFIKREFRRQGLTEQLLHTAVSHARNRGAKTIEAYPVGPDSPSYRFMGLVGMFEKAGFHHIGRAGKWRYVMQLTR